MPKKAEDEKAKERIPVQVTTAEKAELKAGAELLGKKVSTLLREAGLREARRVVQKSEDDGAKSPGRNRATNRSRGQS
jgi:hypothetical protein